MRRRFNRIQNIAAVSLLSLSAAIVFSREADAQVVVLPARAGMASPVAGPGLSAGAVAGPSGLQAQVRSGALSLRSSLPSMHAVRIGPAVSPFRAAPAGAPAPLAPARGAQSLKASVLRAVPTAGMAPASRGQEAARDHSRTRTAARLRNAVGRPGARISASRLGRLFDNASSRERGAAGPVHAGIDASGARFSRASRLGRGHTARSRARRASLEGPAPLSPKGPRRRPSRAKDALRAVWGGVKGVAAVLGSLYAGIQAGDLAYGFLLNGAGWAGALGLATALAGLVWYARRSTPRTTADRIILPTVTAAFALTTVGQLVWDAAGSVWLGLGAGLAVALALAAAAGIRRRRA
ncbi:MAG: hypothetical protein ABII00_17600 [Elusimicrobiota bacterium]